MQRLSSTDLTRRAVEALGMLRRCSLCPRACGVNRLAGERGFCGTGLRPRLAACSLHRGEEPPISGSRGSGNIFFTGCNLACLYCQNYPISRFGTGRDLASGELAEMMISLQRRGAHNVNLVSPTPWVPQIIEELASARSRGFSLPLVYNTGGYDNVSTLRLLEGAVDIYLPDMKYAAAGPAWRFSRAPGYVIANREAIGEMNRQVGPLEVDDNGVARHGTLVRHLVLPGLQDETRGVLGAMTSLFPGLPLSLMFQYFPAWRAVDHPVLGRRLWHDECETVERLLDTQGIAWGWFQEYG